MRLIFYDFEVFLKDWMVVLIDYETRQEKVIVNDRDELVRVYLKIRILYGLAIIQGCTINGS